MGGGETVDFQNKHLLLHNLIFQEVYISFCLFLKLDQIFLKIYSFGIFLNEIDISGRAC